jgi:hypothetical protein
LWPKASAYHIVFYFNILVILGENFNKRNICTKTFNADCHSYKFHWYSFFVQNRWQTEKYDVLIAHFNSTQPCRMFSIQSNRRANLCLVVQADLRKGVWFHEPSSRSINNLLHRTADKSVFRQSKNESDRRMNRNLKQLRAHFTYSGVLNCKDNNVFCVSWKRQLFLA